MMGVICFRPVAEMDLALLHGWMNRPHVQRFYEKKPITMEYLTEKYLPRIRGEKPTFQHLALLDGTPFGHLQCYRVRDYPDYAAAIEQPDGISIDLFIGEPEHLGKGLGHRMLSQYVETVAFPLFPDERLCFIAHEMDNAPALKASAAAGFSHVRDIRENGVPHHLLCRKRAVMSHLPEMRND